MTASVAPPTIFFVSKSQLKFVRQSAQTLASRTLHPASGTPLPQGYTLIAGPGFEKKTFQTPVITGFFGGRPIRFSYRPGTTSVLLIQQSRESLLDQHPQLAYPTNILN